MQIDTMEAFNKGIKEYLGLAKYELIRTTYNDYDLSDKNTSADFRKLFNGYYGIRYDEVWQQEYYRIFQEMKVKENTEKEISYEEIVCKIFSATRRVEKSFASKMLATLNHENPILDSRVESCLRKLGVDLEETETIIECEWFESSFSDLDRTKLSSVILEYRNLVKWYKEGLKPDDANELITCFDKAFPEYMHFTEQRKIDYFLWLLG